MRRRDLGGLARADGLDCLAPLRIRDTEYNDLGDGGMGRNRILDFGWVDILAAGLDQLLGRRAALVPKITLRIEGALVAGVMPIIAD